MEPERYDYDLAERMILKEFGEKLRRGEHVFIDEEDSRLYFGKSIERALGGCVDLDEGLIIRKDFATVPLHMSQRGFSCKVGTRNGLKYVELWFPKRRIQEEEDPEEVTSMIGGPLEWDWGTVQAGVSVVRITTDGGRTWTWGVASGTITIPVGGPTDWNWEEHTF